MSRPLGSERYPRTIPRLRGCAIPENRYTEKEIRERNAMFAAARKLAKEKK